MKRIALLVLFFPVVALAEVTLGIAKAPWGLLKLLPAGARTLFKRAHVQHEGKGYAAFVKPTGT